MQTTPQQVVELSDFELSAVEQHREPARPVWAKAVIVAELERDHSDSQTDYFNVLTEGRPIILAYSRHTRDRFDELRKAAATFAPTAHLGPLCGVFTLSVVLLDDIRPANGWGCYWKGSRSPWHGDPERFAYRAQAEAVRALLPEPEPCYHGEQLVRYAWELTGSEGAIEHREKYSMGAGYYLKASGHYADGWTVRKRAL